MLDNSKLDLGEGSVSVLHDIENSVESSFENINNCDSPSFAGYFLSYMRCRRSPISSSDRSVLVDWRRDLSPH